MTTAWSYVIPGATGLIGVVIGALLTAHWQHGQWVRDNKAREYREVLDELNAFRWRYLNYYARHVAIQGVTGGLDDVKEEKALHESYARLDSLLADRIFTLNAIAKSGVREDLANFFQSTFGADRPTVTKATQAIANIHQRLVQTATSDLRLKKGPGE